MALIAEARTMSPPVHRAGGRGGQSGRHPSLRAPRLPARGASGQARSLSRRPLRGRHPDGNAALAP
jgi:hypothetical protein